MPASQSLSPPQSLHIDTTHDHPVVAAETPQQAQPGTLSDSTIPGTLQPSATLESLLDALDRGIMTENTAPNSTPSPTRRVTDNHAQAAPARRQARPAFDHVIAPAPSDLRVLPSSPTTNQQSTSIAGRILIFFGYGRNNRARKELVSVICSVVVDVSQVST